MKEPLFLCPKFHDRRHILVGAATTMLKALSDDKRAADEIDEY